MNKPYSIGLDIGTNSVGWAVITDNYKVPSKRMKVEGNSDKDYIKRNLLGTLEFDAGNTAKYTRQQRGLGRRTERRTNRVAYLRDIFDDEVRRIDPNFFARLDESFKVPEDKVFSKYSLFGNKKEDMAFHSKYKTIYHLRKKLSDSDEKEDIRLIYLALVHIIKYRGHFLFEQIDPKNVNLKENFSVFVSGYNDAFDDNYDGTVDVDSILTEKVSRSKKVERVLELYPGVKKNSLFAKFINLVVGNKVNFQKEFGLDNECKLQISEDTFNEDLDALQGLIPDEYFEVFYAAKAVYDSMLLSTIVKDISDTNALLSASMIRRYEEHHEDLKKLKLFFKNNPKLNYNEFFNDESKDYYAGYINGKTKEADFYSNTKTLLENVEGAEWILEKIEREDFLRKQRTYDNGAIPHQFHLEELKAIIEKQKKYYPFLEENSKRIESILTFRIPYFVGPLSNGNSRFGWVVRNGNEKIRPWNWENQVDKVATAEQFIIRMTNRCTYFPDEKVLPKHSLLYEKFMVFNELTKIRYVLENNAHYAVSAEMKKNIFEKLFKKYRTVTEKQLLAFFDKEYPDFHIVKVLGLDKKNKNFNSSYGTYHDLKKIMPRDYLDDPKNEQEIEEIISILTLFQDREIIRERLSNYGDSLSKEVLRKLERRHYKGWGRLSKKLLCGIRDRQTQKNIMEFLEDDGYTNRNLMQLINDKNLSFKNQITLENSVDIDSSLEELVKEIPGSPAIRKGIYQSIKIVEEICRVMGYAPESIVIEMAKGPETTAKGEARSSERLEKLKKAFEDLESTQKVELPTDNKMLANNRLYLYYLQNGKDMYTGEDLDIGNLSNYDIDHIIPQSFMKDDSIDNIVLTSSKNNRGKSDNVPSDKVVQRMRGFWKQLLNAGLISERKFYNLTKGKLTEKDKAGFIRRQLVETRQITKHVARILDARFNVRRDDNDKVIRDVNIVLLKSNLVTQFREAFGLYKIREINGFHHAHDAYLNAVVSKAILRKYPKLSSEFVYGDYQVYDVFDLIAKTKDTQKYGKATAKYFFYSNLLNFFKSEIRLADGQIIKRPEVEICNETGEIVWNKKTDLETVRKVLSLPQVNVVKKTEIQTHGITKGKQKGLFNATLSPRPAPNSKENLIPAKRNLDPRKYGGYAGISNSYAILVHAVIEKGKRKTLTDVIEFQGISIMEKEEFEKDEIAFLLNKGYKEIKSILKLPKYSLFELKNGSRRMLASILSTNNKRGEIHKGNQLWLPEKYIKLLYHAKNIKNKENTKHREYVEKHVNELKELVYFVLEFNSRFVDAKKNGELILNELQNWDENDVDKLVESIIAPGKESKKGIFELTAAGSASDFDFLDKKIPRYRDYSPSALLDAVLIRQSITGLYETRIDLSKLGEE